MFLNIMKKSLCTYTFGLALLLAPLSAQAQDFADSQPMPVIQSNDVIPVVSADDSELDMDMDIVTHPPLRMTPDRSEIIDLDKNIGSVVIGNANHLNLLVDSPQRIIAVPRQAGASFFAVLDEDGNMMMQRHVIVASPKEKYVRIRRVCDDGECEPTSVYYCPDMCHQIQIHDGSGSATSAAAAPMGDATQSTGDIPNATAGTAANGATNQ